VVKTAGTLCQAKLVEEVNQIESAVRNGCENNNQIIAINPFGLSIEDMVLAVSIREVAFRLGIGQRFKG
jgi:ornithine cyclodeaminase/alanine dehydrogenase-like protein (mu-crystallin family)